MKRPNTPDRDFYPNELYGPGRPVKARKRNSPVVERAVRFAERIELALRQAAEPRTFILWTTHEAWLLSQLGSELYVRLKRQGNDFSQADSGRRIWIINQILSGRSRESYTRKQYIKAGGLGFEYDIIVKAWKKWAKFPGIRKGTKHG